MRRLEVTSLIQADEDSSIEWKLGRHPPLRHPMRHGLTGEEERQFCVFTLDAALDVTITLRYEADS